MIVFIYVAVALYSLFCGPWLFFRLFPNADALGEPEVAFCYIAFILVSGFTLVAAVARLWHWARTLPRTVNEDI
jgi:hypothetical protein